jgi:outer membrane protein, heavy metal efflux system
MVTSSNRSKKWKVESGKWKENPFSFLLSPFSFLLILLILLLSFSLAQDTPQPLTLEQALSLAPNVDAAIISARTDLASAQRDQERVKADPLSLRLDILQAEQKVASQQETFDRALLSNRLNATEAFFNALQADESLANAQKQFEIANATLAAQQIRYQAGAITQIDLSNAQNDAVEAERSVSDAQNTRNLAYSQLVSKLGQEPAGLLPYTAEAPQLAPLEQFQAQALEKNSQLNALKRNVNLAQVQLEIVDNAFSSRSQIDSAKDALSNAQLNLNDYQSTLGLSIESSYNSVLSANASYQNALESFNTATNDLSAQKTRLDAGSISPIAYSQSELSFAQKQAALNRSKHQLLVAFTRLEQAVLGQGTGQ